MEQTFFGLVKHVRWLLWNRSFSEWRISRGEYWVGILLLSTVFAAISSVVWLLCFAIFQLPESAVSNGVFSALSIIGSVLIPLVVTILQVKFIIKRSHDLGKSGRYVYIPMFIILWCLLIAFAVLFSQWFFSASAPTDIMNIMVGLQSNVVLWIIWIIGFIALIRSLARWIVIGFYKGNVGDNVYGSDPLVSQPTENGLYRWVWIVLLVVNVILGSINTNLQGAMFEDEMNFNDPALENMQDMDELEWSDIELPEPKLPELNSGSVQ